MTKEPTDSFPILIAEDNAVSRKLLENSLAKAGHDVVAAANGRQAFEIFRETFFPMVLTDWMMPEMDGIALCRAIRNHASPGYVYIVFLTAKDSRDDIIAGLEAGADDYLTKPFHPTELMARLTTGKRILELERSLKMANEEIRILSITDHLTGCFNRGYMTSHLPEELNRASRYGHPLSLIMCDIDRFKNVNDSRGHLAGDSVLRLVVDFIHEALRKDIDWAVRYGGEEFLIVLPETDREGAWAVAERLRQEMATKPIAIGDQEIAITASFGLASFDPGMDKKP
ncbi:MAG: diguanylate cyclase, partial [Deltaproteobacteria bacterium]